MADQPKQLTYEELLEQLKDPSILHAVAAKHGMKVVKEGERERKQPVPEPKKLRERPKLVIPEDAELKDVVQALSKHTEDLTSYYEDLVASKSEEVTQQVRGVEERQLLKDVRAFAAKHKDFDSLVPVIEPLVSSGKYGLEEAYKLARKAKGLPEEEGGQKTPEPSKEKPKISSFSSADEGGDAKTDLKPKVTTIRDAAKNNLSKILSEMPEAEKALSEDQAGE